MKLALIGLLLTQLMQGPRYQEGWQVVVTYHEAEVQMGGTIVWKQLQWDRPGLMLDLSAARATAEACGRNGFWLHQNAGTGPGDPEDFVPPGAIHRVALVYTYVEP